MSLPKNGRDVFASGMKQVEALVESLESCADPSLRNAAGELVAAVMDLHGAALARMMELAAETSDSAPLERFAEDPLVRSILLLHDLHPSSVESRVAEALEQVRPSLKAHHGDVDLLEISDGVVRLRLQGTCNGCPSSTSTFRGLIQSAITELAPEIQKIEVEGMTDL